MFCLITIITYNTHKNNFRGSNISSSMCCIEIASQFQGRDKSVYNGSWCVSDCRVGYQKQQATGKKDFNVFMNLEFIFRLQNG